jgi:cysteinyl-tRNA synthetase
MPALTPRTTPPPLPKVLPQRAQSDQVVTRDVAPARIPKVRSIVRRALVGLVTLVVFAVGGALLLDASIDRGEEGAAASEEGRARLANVTSWGYQLQHLDLNQVATAPHDLIVVDETLAGSGRGKVSGSDLARLKRKPDGQRRLVLSYLSIGEAEDYRGYWRSSWVVPAASSTRTGALAELAAIGATPARAQLRLTMAGPDKPLNQPTAAAPAWLGLENAEWRGNYGVRFWHPDWKAVVFGNPDAALDRIIAAGFDGVYLDRADVYNNWRRDNPTAKADMVTFIGEIASYARQQKPGFLVVMQNAEELLSSKHLRDALDGVAKEDLLYGVAAEGRENSAADIEASLSFLKLARNDGLPVLVIEYLHDNETMAKARRRIEGEGFVPYFGPRLLNSLERDR